MSGGRARAGEAGFSLMETVVAIAVIGLLSLVVFEVAKLSRSGYARSVSASEAYRGGEATRRLLTRLFARAAPVMLEDRGGERATFFVGEARRLTLVAPYAALSGPLARHADDLSQRGGLAVVSVGQEDQAGGAALVLRHAPLGVSAENRERTQGEGLTLLTAPGSFSFRYFGPERDGEPESARWLKRWRLRSDPPRAVSLSFAGGPQGQMIFALGRDAGEDAL